MSNVQQLSDEGVRFYRIIRATGKRHHHVSQMCVEQEQTSRCRRVRLFRGSPQTAGGVAQQQGRLELDPVFVAVSDGAPARVRDDDRVCERGQSIADDGHLHRVT